MGNYFKEKIMVQVKILSYPKVAIYLINYFRDFLKKLLNAMEKVQRFLK